MTRSTFRATPSRRRAMSPLVAACLAVAVAGCASTPAATPGGHRVTVRTTATALPGPSYAWIAMPVQLDAEKDERVEDPAFRARMQGALDAALQAKGYRVVADMAAADFLVAWRAGVRDLQQVDVRTSGGGSTSTPQAAVSCGAGGCSQLVTVDGGGKPVVKLHETDYVEGGLLVEAIDPKTVHLLWSALNRGTVRATGAAHVDLDAAARETLAAMPAAPAQ